MSKFSCVTLVLSLSLCTCAVAQMKRNSVYLEVGGNGGFYSLNYDRLVTVSEKVGFAPRIGVSWLGDDKFLIPVEANLLLGNQKMAKNFGEFGIGATVVTKPQPVVDGFSIVEEKKDEKGMKTLLTSRIGYRHQKLSGGFMYRFGFILLFNSNKILPFGGISLGYSY